MKHFPTLDGLRGIAILLVIWVHAYSYHGDSTIGKAFQAFAKTGWIGVNLFFVLSGFLISRILIETQEKPHRFRDFWIRRVLRICPVYFVFLAIYFFAIPLIPWVSDRLVQPPRETAYCYWTYLVNLKESLTGYHNEAPALAHLWSLGVEWQVYLVWPLILFALPKRYMPYFFLLLIPIAFAWRFWTRYTAQSLEMTVWWPIGNLEFFALGGLVAWMFRFQPQLLTRWSLRLVVASGLVLLAAFLYWGHFYYFLSPVWITTLGFSVLGIFFASWIGYSITSSPENGTNRFLCNNWLGSVGKYSYTMYLVHAPIVVLLAGQIDHEDWVQCLGLVGVVTVTSYGLAWISWHCFEKHFQGWKRSVVILKEQHR